MTSAPEPSERRPRDPMEVFLKGYILGFLDAERRAARIPLKVAMLSVEYRGQDDDPAGLLITLASGKVLRVRATVIADAGQPAGKLVVVDKLP